jgi:hypothetical protein
MEASAATKQTTKYVVLEQREAKTVEEAGELRANFYWVECEQIAARSAHDAIRTYAKANGIADKGGTFFAVPARSWNPVKVAVETQTRLTLS